MNDEEQSSSKADNLFRSALIPELHKDLGDDLVSMKQAIEKQFPLWPLEKQEQVFAVVFWRDHLLTIAKNNPRIAEAIVGLRHAAQQKKSASTIGTVRRDVRRKMT